MNVREQIEVLRSDTCQCGRPKERRMALCRGCWFFLSDDVRKALYDRVPKFGEAYEAALEDLRGVEQLANGAAWRAHQRKGGRP